MGLRRSCWHISLISSGRWNFRPAEWPSDLAEQGSTRLLEPFHLPEHCSLPGCHFWMQWGGQKYCFKAIKGWDAATGWGTPNYEALAKAVMNNVNSVTNVIV